MDSTLIALMAVSLALALAGHANQQLNALPAQLLDMLLTLKEPVSQNVEMD